MKWDGIERRKGQDRRRNDRRCGTSFSIKLILSGEANRRTGQDRRRNGRRLTDQSEEQTQPESLTASQESFICADTTC